MTDSAMHYPDSEDSISAGTTSIDLGAYQSILDVLHRSCKKFSDKCAFSNMGKELSYGELHRQSGYFAAYLLNNTNLQAGDRIAIQLPNILQFPVAVFGALRAGLIVVNTNPLYTKNELVHQFSDAKVKAVVVLANFAHTLEKVLPEVPQIEHVFITQLGDFIGGVKGPLINFAVKKIKKMVPPYNIPQAISFNRVLKSGAHCTLDEYDAQQDDVALLQYTGGTTGVAKGAMITHKNILANMLQIHKVLTVVYKDGVETMISPLPLYHIYSFTVNCMAMMLAGNHSLLITNPRDIPTFIKTIKNVKFTGFLGLNTLFVALCNNPEFKEVDFSQLKITIAGGMALTKNAAQQWREITSCEICEGYGLTETSPVVAVNPPDAIQLGTIGPPLPDTEVRVIDDNGKTLTVGEEGELCVRGPQVMRGYWQRPEETAAVMTEDGWFKTGDIALIQEDDYIRIVDRKKDMIIVSGFNVYPNEIEDVLTTHKDIIECAAVGVVDEKSGERVKVFLVSSNKSLTAEEVKDYCREQLSNYKVPKIIEFRDELPKTNVGKILRRELRNGST